MVLVAQFMGKAVLLEHETRHEKAGCALETCSVVGALVILVAPSASVRIAAETRAGDAGTK